MNLLLWTLDTSLDQSLFRRQIPESFERWAYRNGLTQRVSRLEKMGMLEAEKGSGSDRVYRLTPKGRLTALGGRDPDERWHREWDGKWRLAMFDLPVASNTERARLRRYLLSRGFGCVQKSVWISPDSVEAERKLLAKGRIDVGSLLLLEARPCAGESDEEIVAGAWDFDAINERYRRHMAVLERRPSEALAPGNADAFGRWTAEERGAWFAAMEKDPLLPEALLPAGYLGKQAWSQRKKTLRQAAKQMNEFDSNT